MEAFYFLIELYKALEELDAAKDAAGKYGIWLIHDGHRGYGVIDLYGTRSELHSLTKCLTLGEQFTIDTGSPDQRARGYVVMEKLCYVIASFENTAVKFNDAGLVLTPNAFGGHYQKAQDACRRAFGLLCNVDTDTAEAYAMLDKFTTTGYEHTISQLYRTYSHEVDKTLETIEKLK